MVHGAYLCAEDATFAGKASKKMLGVQKWKDHSGNPDRGGYLFGHNWAILGLLSPFRGRWLCFSILARLIPGQKNPAQFVSTPEGLRPADFWDVTVSNVLYTWELRGRRALRVVADAYFANASFIKPLMEKGIAVISRLRKNAIGWDDPPKYPGRGRPRKRGKKWKLADLLKEKSALSFARARHGLRQFVIKQIFLNSALTPDFKKIEDE